MGYSSCGGKELDVGMRVCVPACVCVKHVWGWACVCTSYGCMHVYCADECVGAGGKAR